MKEQKILDDAKLICGLVMPISAIDGCNEQHWIDIKEIVSEAIEDSGFTANLVSYADDVGIIQKRIIQNLYDNPIVVCDVSGKNPNVMFELGLRLAFDKPTIIIKDDKTSYSFDTSPIEHLEYPRDLRFTKIIDFKKNLTEKIKATYEKSQTDSSYTTFLKHFGTFTVAKLDSQEVSKEDYIIEELKDLKRSISRQERLSLQSQRSKYFLNNELMHDEHIDDRHQSFQHERIVELMSLVEKEISKLPISKTKKISLENKNKIRHNIMKKFPITEEDDINLINNVIEGATS